MKRTTVSEPTNPKTSANIGFPSAIQLEDNQQLVTLPTTNTTLLHSQLAKIQQAIALKFPTSSELAKLSNELVGNVVVMQDLSNPLDQKMLTEVAQAGLEISTELLAKIKGENRTTAALLKNEFQAIDTYYQGFLTPLLGLTAPTTPLSTPVTASTPNPSSFFNSAKATARPSQSIGNLSAKKDITADQMAAFAVGQHIGNSHSAEGGINLKQHQGFQKG